MRAQRTVHDVIKEQTDASLVFSLRQTEMSEDFELFIIREALARILENLVK